MLRHTSRVLRQHVIKDLRTSTMTRRRRQVTRFIRIPYDKGTLTSLHASRSHVATSRRHVFLIHLHPFYQRVVRFRAIPTNVLHSLLHHVGQRNRPLPDIVNTSRVIRSVHHVLYHPIVKGATRQLHIPMRPIRRAILLRQMNMSTHARGTKIKTSLYRFNTQYSINLAGLLHGHQLYRRSRRTGAGRRHTRSFSRDGPPFVSLFTLFFPRYHYLSSPTIHVNITTQTGDIKYILMRVTLVGDPTLPRLTLRRQPLLKMTRTLRVGVVFTMRRVNENGIFIRRVQGVNPMMAPTGRRQVGNRLVRQLRLGRVISKMARRRHHEL